MRIAILFNYSTQRDCLLTKPVVIFPDGETCLQMKCWAFARSKIPLKGRLCTDEGNSIVFLWFGASALASREAGKLSQVHDKHNRTYGDRPIYFLGSARAFSTNAKSRGTIIVNFWSRERELRFQQFALLGAHLLFDKSPLKKVAWTWGHVACCTCNPGPKQWPWVGWSESVSQATA